MPVACQKLNLILVRSITATTIFFITACLTSRLVYQNALPPSRATDWTIGQHGRILLGLQGVATAISGSVYYLVRLLATFLLTELTWVGQTRAGPSTHESPPRASTPGTLTTLRILTSLTTGFQFAIALRLSNLTDPNRVISFLLLPTNSSFDPSLAFLAVGALPLATLLYHFVRRDGRPRLGGQWAIPKSGEIDIKLVLGAAIFGIGWGLAGICRELYLSNNSFSMGCSYFPNPSAGPGVVNLGRALSNGSNFYQAGIWLGTVILGSLIV